jgi:hypothetical protein
VRGLGSIYQQGDNEWCQVGVWMDGVFMRVDFSSILLRKLQAMYIGLPAYYAAHIYMHED